MRTLRLRPVHASEAGVTEGGIAESGPGPPDTEGAVTLRDDEGASGVRKWE